VGADDLNKFMGREKIEKVDSKGKKMIEYTVGKKAGDTGSYLLIRPKELWNKLFGD
jgi:hypothetical protein